MTLPLNRSRSYQCHHLNNGAVVSEEKMIKESRRRRTTEAYVSCKLINEPSDQGS